MKIAIDLDGTITDFYTYLITYGRQFGKKHFNNDRIKDYNGFEVEEIFDWDSEEILIFKDYIRKELRNIVTPRIFAKDALKILKQKGYQIYILTSRKNTDLINPKENTLIWLKENEIPFDYLIIGNSNKLEECIKNKIDIFIDDKYKHYLKTEEYGIKSYLFDNPYNKNYSALRVHDFYELLLLLSD